MESKISKLSGMLRQKKISAAELTEEYIKNIENKNPLLNAYVRLCFDAARENAKKADLMLSKNEGGLLTGIPFALKDNICTKGIETGCCSRVLENYRPLFNAYVAEKLHEQGAVMLGKTNMDEFAMGSSTETGIYGPAKNPNNPEYVTGGSSGGSAAAVSSGMAVFSLGSDTGGSVRQPAGFCGVAGFKPGYGTVSRRGLIAYASSMDVIGFFGNTVSDVNTVFSAVSGRDAKDMTSQDVMRLPADSTKKSSPVNMAGFRIGLIKELFTGLQDECEAVIMRAVKKAESAGADIKQISVPELKSALQAYYIIACAEASSNLGRYDGIRYGNPGNGEKGFGAEVKKRIMLGTYVLSKGYYEQYYQKACLIRRTLMQAFSRAFKEYDVLVSPVSPVRAWKIGEKSLSDAQDYMADLCTVPVNLAGLPAVSINAGNDQNGCGVGLQLIGGRNDDFKLLGIAERLESLINSEESVADGI